MKSLLVEGSFENALPFFPTPHLLSPHRSTSRLCHCFPPDSGVRLPGKYVDFAMFMSGPRSSPSSFPEFPRIPAGQKLIISVVCVASPLSLPYPLRCRREVDMPFLLCEVDANTGTSFVFRALTGTLAFHGGPRGESRSRSSSLLASPDHTRLVPISSPEPVDFSPLAPRRTSEQSGSVRIPGGHFFAERDHVRSLS